MKILFNSTFYLLLMSPAYAEVCDKVRPNWNPENGRVTQYEEILYFFSTPFGAGLLALIIVAFFIKKFWFSFVCSLAILLTALIIFADWFWLGDTVANYAYLEGCLVSPIITCVILFVIAASLIVFSLRFQTES